MVIVQKFTIRSFITVQILNGKTLIAWCRSSAVAWLLIAWLRFLILFSVNPPADPALTVCCLIWGGTNHCNLFDYLLPFEQLFWHRFYVAWVLPAYLFACQQLPKLSKLFQKVVNALFSLFYFSAIRVIAWQCLLFSLISGN